jgi:hypothetical protein
VGTNNKAIRFAKARWGVQRAFVEATPQFETCSRLLFLYITCSDTLSRKNIMDCETYLTKFRDNQAFQVDPLFEARVLQLGDALRKAKDRLLFRMSKRELNAEVRAKKAERKARKEPAPITAPAIEPSSIWEKAVAEREKI